MTRRQRHTDQRVEPPSETTEVVVSGPQLSEQQRIGQDAKRLFIFRHPRHWIVKDLDGDSDFGLDLKVQIARTEGDKRIVHDLFFVQVKGTEKPEGTKDGKFVYLKLEEKTCQYLLRQPAAIMLALCDLSVDPTDLNNCPVYYCWFGEDSLSSRSRSSAKSRAKIPGYRIKVPKSNLLNAQTDVGDYLNRARHIRRAGQLIETRIRELEPHLDPTARLDGLNRVIGNLTKRATPIISVLSAEMTTAWPQAPAQSLPGFLERAKQSLRYGDIRGAGLSLEKAFGLLSTASEIDVGEYWFILGQLRSLEGRPSEASSAFLQAISVQKPASRHIAAWAESEFQSRLKSDNILKYPDLLERLTSSGAETLDIRARILATEGRFPEAREVANQIDGPSRWLTISIVCLMEGEPTESLRFCEAGLVEVSLPSVISENLLIIRARASYELAVRGEHAPAETGNHHKIQNPDLLPRAWEHAVEALRALQVTGWGVNIEAIADIVASLALAMNREAEVLPLLQSAGQNRPRFTTLQRALEDVAAASDNFPLALAANSQTEDSDGKLLRRLIMLHDSGRFADCLEEFKERGRTTTQEHPLFAIALIQAIESADRLHRKGDADQLLSLLESLPGARWEKALLKFIRSNVTNAPSREASIQELEADYLDLQEPPELGAVLFNKLDPSDALQAGRCYEVGARLHSVRLITLEEAVRLAQCLITLGRWEDLIQFIEEALLRFGPQERLLAIKAIGSDRLGETPKALEILQRLVEAPVFDSVTHDAYIEIVSRCGFVKEAIDALEQVLANAESKAAKLNTLRLLFQLLHYENPEDKRCVEIAGAIGRLVDPEVECEEGLYLILFLAATTFLETALALEQVGEFQQRAEAFFQRFPKSRILARFEVSNENPVQDLERAIESFGGKRASAHLARKRFLDALDRGQLVLPFALRSAIIPGRYDVASLWEACKRSGSKDKRFRLIMTAKGWTAMPISAIEGKVLLLDFLTINILHDLDLWEALFRLVPVIAISQLTMRDILISGTPIIGSAFAGKCREIQAVIRTYMDRILQPRSDIPEEDELLVLGGSLAEIVAVIRDSNGKYLSYSDDFIFRQYCATIAGNEAKTFCTLDLLEALGEAGLLELSAVAEKVAQLALWNAQVNIYLKYIVQIIPCSVEAATTLTFATELLERSVYFGGLAREIWNHEKTVDDLMMDSVGLLVIMMHGERRALTIAAVMGNWLSKVRLHRSAPAPIRLISLVLVYAAAHFPAENPANEPEDGFYHVSATYAKLWSVFRLLIELEFQKGMDERKERESIELAGEVAAELDHANSLEGSAATMYRLQSGLVEGTSDWDSFSRGHQRFWRRVRGEQASSLKKTGLGT